MDPNDTEKKNVDDKLREAVTSELDAYIDPQSAPKDALKTAAPIVEQKIDSEIRESETAKPKENPPASALAKPIIRTYKSDMEETIQAGHLSSINMAISENNKMMRQMKAESIETKKTGRNKNILIISLVLLFGGAAAILIPYFLVNKQAGTPTPTASALSNQTIMTTDVEEKINIKDINLNGIDTTLNQRVEQSSTNLGQIKDFLLTEGSGVNEKPLTASEFLTLIKADVPSEIARNLLPQYMFGMHNYNGNQEFLILKVSSYDTTFSGMLSWETDLWQNFQNLFGLTDAAPASVNASSTATSSPANQSSFGITVKKFQDAAFDNKDARVVKDASGNIVFLYSIIDPNTIVITTSPDTLKEIISRTSGVNTVTQ